MELLNRREGFPEQPTFFEEFCKEWSSERLAIYAGLMQRNIQTLQEQLPLVNTSWEQLSKDFFNRKNQIDAMLDSIHDYRRRATILAREAYNLLGLQWSELREVFSFEKQSNIYIYADQMLILAAIMHRRPISKDVYADDMESIELLPELGISVRFIDPSESPVTRQNRYERRLGLTQVKFGAKQPLELFEEEKSYLTIPDRNDNLGDIIFPDDN